jgi:hypothetical protein
MFSKTSNNIMLTMFKRIIETSNDWQCYKHYSSYDADSVVKDDIKSKRAKLIKRYDDIYCFKNRYTQFVSLT